jgi:bifunctional enzyme Fae/Hps
MNQGIPTQAANIAADNYWSSVRYREAKQAAVAKAVADSVEENVIPRDKVDDWVIICSVFIHPQASDFRKIYQYNYGATNWR